MSRYIVRKLCLWYNNIYRYSKNFKIVGVPWLSDDYVLPENISEWLNLPWLNNDTEMYKRIYMCNIYVQNYKN
jgi:hypothetical protein